MKILKALGLLVLSLLPTSLLAQAGTPVRFGPWQKLNMASDVHSQDLGCYDPAQVTVAPRNLQITMVAVSNNCGQTNSQSGTFTTTQAYKSGSIILTGFPISPSVGQPVTVTVKAQMSRGWHAAWLLGVNCNPALLGTWDNGATCAWDSDASSSSEIDLAEATLNSYAEMGHSLHSSGSQACTVNMPGGADATAGVHTYTMIWSTASLSMFVDGSNTGCSYSGIPTHPMYLIIETRQQTGKVDASLPSTTSVQFVQVCKSAVSGCTNPDTPVGTGNTVFYDDFSTYKPVVDFTDLISGPATGGENNNGTILTIYGHNFGATQGSSTVTVGGHAVASYLTWGGHSAAVTPAAQLETISVAIGATATTGSVVVTTGAGASTCEDPKDNCQFTVRAGSIRCVSLTGNDSNTGNFPSSCWRTITKAAHTVAAGDIAYIENGLTATGQDNFNTNVLIQNSGTVPSPMALVVYPGATATVGACPGGDQNRGIRSDSNNWVLAGFTICAQLEGTQNNGANGVRWVDNDVSCPNGTGADACNHAENGAANILYYGNYLHDTGTNCGADCKLYHDFYMSTNTNHVWLGWNEISPNPAQTAKAGCRAIQFFSTGGADQFDLHVHDNYIHDAICDGINFSTVNPDLGGTVEAYNNVVWRVGTGPAPAGGDSDYSCFVAGGGGTTPVLIYNNSCYDTGGRRAADSGTIYVARPVSMWNNAIQQLSGEVFLTSSSVPVGNLTGSNNIWSGVAGAPSQTTGNITSLPSYTNPGAGDLTLTGSSPAIGAGTAAHTTVWDFSGFGRPNPPAIGAYEFKGIIASSLAPPTNLRAVPLNIP